MIRFILRLGVLVLLAASIVLNVLALSGLFQRDLIREKDRTIARFESRVDDLQRKNAELSAALTEFDRAMREYEKQRIIKEEKLTKLLQIYETVKVVP
jgi:septal ring factor EnvC (AmiA/AmiB activator)